MMRQIGRPDPRQQIAHTGQSALHCPPPMLGNMHGSFVSHLSCVLARIWQCDTHDGKGVIEVQSIMQIPRKGIYLIYLLLNGHCIKHILSIKVELKTCTSI